MDDCFVRSLPRRTCHFFCFVISLFSLALLSCNALLPPTLFFSFFKLYNPTKHLVDAPLVCLLLLSSSVSRMRLRQLSDLKWSTAVLPQSHTDTLAHKHKGVGCVRTPAKRPVLTLILDYAQASCCVFILSSPHPPIISLRVNIKTTTTTQENKKLKRATHKSARHPLISRLAV